MSLNQARAQKRRHLIVAGKGNASLELLDGQAAHGDLVDVHGSEGRLQVGGKVYIVKTDQREVLWYTQVQALCRVRGTQGGMVIAGEESRNLRIGLQQLPRSLFRLI